MARSGSYTTSLWPLQRGDSSLVVAVALNVISVLENIAHT